MQTKTKKVIPPTIKNVISKNKIAKRARVNVSIVKKQKMTQKAFRRPPRSTVDLKAPRYAHTGNRSFLQQIEFENECCNPQETFFQSAQDRTGNTAQKECLLTSCFLQTKELACLTNRSQFPMGTEGVISPTSEAKYYQYTKQNTMS